MTAIIYRWNTGTGKSIVGHTSLEVSRRQSVMERPDVSAINECWRMDFVADSLFNGKRSRALTVVNNLSRECLAITVDRRLRDDDVVATMEHVQSIRGTPKRIQIDNGSEFIAKHQQAGFF